MNLIIEIDGEKHRFVKRISKNFACNKCSLFQYCDSDSQRDKEWKTGQIIYSLCLFSLNGFRKVKKEAK